MLKQSYLICKTKLVAIIQSAGGLNNLSRQIGISREALYRMLNAPNETHLQDSTIRKIMRKTFMSYDDVVKMFCSAKDE